MAITAEQFEQLPDFLKSDYVQQGEQYAHKDSIKVDGLKSSLDNLDAKMREAERKRQEELDAAAAAAREAALTEAKKANNIDEILRIEREQAEDAKRRAIEDAKGEWQRELSESQAKQRADALAKEIALIVAVDESAAELIELAIRPRIKHDIDLKKDVFSDRQGSALSVDKAAFVELIKKEPQFSRLAKFTPPTEGAGGANGSNGGSAPSKPLKDMTDAERIEFKRNDPDGFRRALSAH